MSKPGRYYGCHNRPYGQGEPAWKGASTKCHHTAEWPNDERCKGCCHQVRSVTVEDMQRSFLGQGHG